MNPDIAISLFIMFLLIGIGVITLAVLAWYLRR